MVGQLTNRVLLVDDAPVIRKLISGYLVAAGYVVRTAVDGLNALEELRAGLPDLIISDLNMPRMSGVEFLKVVRKRFPQIRVIAISALAADEIPKEVPADAYYYKSGFGFDPLLQTVLDLTRKPAPRTARPRIDYKPVPARWDGDGHYDVRCPDCMRSIKVPRDPKLIHRELTTTCSDCRGVIRLLGDDGDSRAGEPAGVSSNV
jgi:CheY-like chemotaxis protein